MRVPEYWTAVFLLSLKKNHYKNITDDGGDGIKNLKFNTFSFYALRVPILFQIIIVTRPAHYLVSNT